MNANIHWFVYEYIAATTFWCLAKQENCLFELQTIWAYITTESRTTYLSPSSHVFYTQSSHLILISSIDQLLGMTSKNAFIISYWFLICVYLISGMTEKYIFVTNAIKRRMNTSIKCNAFVSPISILPKYSVHITMSNLFTEDKP